MVRIQQSQWYAGLGIWGVVSAINDAMEQKGPLMLLVYIPILIHKLVTAVSATCMSNSEIAVGLAAAVTLIVVVLFLYIVNVAFKQVFLFAV